MAMVLRSLSSSACRRLRCLSSISILSLPAISSSTREISSSSPSPRLSSFLSPAVHQNRVSKWNLHLIRLFSGTTSQLPCITDPEVESAFKDLMAMTWDEIPDSVISNTKKALSKATEDKAGHEALANLCRAAEASVEFGGVLVSLRMALDDLSGVTGENVAQLPEYLEDAMKAAYNRYMTYLGSFGPDEAYLRKKVESELGTKMIHIKMRCSGIGSEWGKYFLVYHSFPSSDPAFRLPFLELLVFLGPMSNKEHKTNKNPTKLVGGALVTPKLAYRDAQQFFASGVFSVLG